MTVVAYLIAALVLWLLAVVGLIALVAGGSR